MTDKGKKEDSSNRINESKRFSYIGFEVFPGEPKDLFKSDAEKKKLVEKVRSRRDRHEITREDCKLLEERVTLSDKIVLTIASVLVFAAMFAPWYAAYNEIVEESTVKAAPVNPTDSLGLLAQLDDSLAMINDSGAINPTATDAVNSLEDSVGGAVAAVTENEVPPSSEADETATTEGIESTKSVIQKTANEQIIHGYTARKSIHKEYGYMSGIGMFTSLGTLGSTVFSSGFILMVSAIIMLLYVILCIALPGYTLYGLWGIKGNADTQALALKKIVKYNWIPVLMFVLLLFLSFFGADYGFDAEAMYSSLGDSYSAATLFGTLSWGIIVSLCGFVLVAAKGSEI